uniref:lysozyme n=1 Tax=Strigamia maritima TaxID=126957 RepID=T1JAY4_STRMM
MGTPRSHARIPSKPRRITVCIATELWAELGGPGTNDAIDIPSNSTDTDDSSPISPTNHPSLDASGHTLLISTSSSATDEDESANAIWTDEKRMTHAAHRALSLPSQPVGRWCLDCICQASSGCEVSGCEGGFCGPYKISREYWIDAGRPGFYVAGDPRAFTACGVNKTCAERTIQNYMNLFRRDCNTDGRIDCWDFARIHLAGPANCHANWVERTPFWEKFVECQEELEAVRPANNGQSATSPAFVRPSAGSSTFPAATVGGVESGSDYETDLDETGVADVAPAINHDREEVEEEPVSRLCLDCIFQVVTGCDQSRCSSLTVNDPYQISLAYWIDAGRPWSKQRNSNGKVYDITDFIGFHSCARNKSCAEQAIQNYMKKFGRDCNKDGVVNCLDFARIHKAGPYACDALWMESHNFLTRIKQCQSKWTDENLIQHGVTNIVESAEIKPTQKPVWQTQWVKAPLIVTADPSVHKQTSAHHFPPPRAPFTHFPRPNFRPNPSNVGHNNAIPSTAWRGSETSVDKLSLLSTPTMESGRPNSKHPDKIVTSPLWTLTTQSIRDTHRLPVEQVPRLVDFNCMRCLCEASSGCEERVCAFGLCGPYQLSQEYWNSAEMAHVLQPGEIQDFQTCATNKSCSETVIQFYMSKFHRDCDQSGQIDCWDFARLHLAGAGQCHAQWIIRSGAWTKFSHCQSRHAHSSRTTTASAPVEQSEGQGQIPPGRRNPPFVIIPPENERIKGAASDRLEVVLPEFPSEDDSLFVPTQNPSQIQEVDVNKVLDRKCYNCICQASSRNCSSDITSCITTGPNQYFCGPYHISWAYWADSGKPGDVIGDPTAFEECLLDKDCAERSVLGYMTKFQRDCNNDGVIDCTDFLLIHKMGHLGCTEDWVYTSAFWKTFTQCWGSGLDFRFNPK